MGWWWKYGISTALRNHHKNDEVFDCCNYQWCITTINCYIKTKSKLDNNSCIQSTSIDSSGSCTRNFDVIIFSNAAPIFTKIVRSTMLFLFSPKIVRSQIEHRYDQWLWGNWCVSRLQHFEAGRETRLTHHLPNWKHSRLSNIINY